MRFNIILGIEGVEWIERRMSHFIYREKEASKSESLMKINKLFSKVVNGESYI